MYSPGAWVCKSPPPQFKKFSKSKGAHTPMGIINKPLLVYYF